MPLMRFSQRLFIAALGVAAALSPAGAQEPRFVPVTDAVLQRPDPADWLRWRRDQSAGGYSPLDQVNRQNVPKLRLAWAWAMEAGPQQQEPLVYRGVMYLPHPNNVVQALDARTGALIWEYRRKFPEDVGTGDTTRNIAIYQDKIFLATQDAYLVALDARSGSVVWEAKVADYRQRINYSAGPIAGDGKVFAGLTCGVGTPFACFVSAHDAETGKQLWRRESVAGPGDPEEHNATWGRVPYEGRKKASFWLAGSYDPGLKLLYWTTASAYPYPEILKGSGSGAVLYTNSILALNAETGAIKWFFQMQPRDNFDMDHQDNPILADVEMGGAKRKAVYALGKPGILWAFDRETGTHLWNRQLVTYQNIYKHIDPKTGAITMNEGIIPREVGASQAVCPGMRGGKLFQTHAYNPRTNALYSPVSNECTTFEVVPLNVNASGVKYDRIAHMEGAAGKVGRLAAVSASTGELLWTYDQRAAMGSVLTTAGGLVFAGDFHRYFRAFDAETGKVLWEIPLSAPVTGYPISYAVDGKQYVAIAVGGGTSGQRHLAQLYPELKAPVGSNILMVFALGE
ncbi:MAG: PQQ-binding-like beta-propeller repeat protein [Acidobacteria bacterium]|nr:PQQ-binding-like beta-propeller repeat protein [Acidobacteriota bacterium]